MTSPTAPTTQPSPDEPPHQAAVQLTIFDALDEETADETHR